MFVITVVSIYDLSSDLKFNANLIQGKSNIKNKKFKILTVTFFCKSSHLAPSVYNFYIPYKPNLR